MDQFKNRLLKMRRIPIVGIAVLAAAAAVLLVLGIMQSTADYESFDPLKNGYAKMDVTFLMGPFAGATKNGRTTEEYYVAQTTDEDWFVVAEKVDPGLPIYGEDVGEEDVDRLEGRTVYGKSTKIEPKLVSFLVDFFEDSDLEITASNYKMYFGDHYLDMTVSAGETSVFLYLLAAVFCAVAVCLGVGALKNKKRIAAATEDLEKTGRLQDLYDDFAAGQPVWSPKLRLAAADHYVLDFSRSKEGFRVLPLQNIVNVYRCNMMNGKPTTTNFIALETAEGDRYCLAQSSSVSEEFSKMIALLKDRIEGGAQ